MNGHTCRFANNLRCDCDVGVDDPWFDGKGSVQHLTECDVDGCDRCEYLVDGFYMACDQCGSWGHQESSGWVMAKNIPFCSEACARSFLGAVDLD